MLAPAIARPLSSVLGRPLARLLGTPGQLGRENSMRNPRRTAQTAAALMVGLALVSAIAVLGSSLSASAKRNVDNAIAADYLITGSGGVSKSVAPVVEHVPGVDAIATIYSGQFEFRGSLSSLTATTPARLDRTVHLSMTAGTAAPALAGGDLARSQSPATRAASRRVPAGAWGPGPGSESGSKRDRRRRRPWQSWICPDWHVSATR